MIDHLDHLVLTTADEAACVDFYGRVLGMRIETFAGGSPAAPRRAFKFGAQKINLHVKGAEFEPKAHLPVPGALDLCFIAAIALNDVIERLEAARWPILEGPVLRTGATGPIRSVYLRDPDLNLIEISERGCRRFFQCADRTRCSARAQASAGAGERSPEAGQSSAFAISTSSRIAASSG